jgi:hypothetical protein
MQEAHREISSREGVVRDFLDKQVPEDWPKWPLDKRRMFWAGGTQDDIPLVNRDRVCAMEVWCEAFGGGVRDMRQSDTRELNAIIESLPEWRKSSSPIRMGTYGPQRGFVKK